MAQKTRDVQTEINYFHDTGQKLVPMVIGGPDPPTPQAKIRTAVTIRDVTGNEDKYSLDHQGFQYVKHKASIEDWMDDETVSKVHFPEVEELCRKVLLGCKTLPKPSSIHIMTHIIREGAPDGEAQKPAKGPIYGVHMDQSLSAATGVAQRWLGGAAEELLKKPRWQIINIWRPIRPITRDPFAVCDAQSVPNSDIIAVPIIFPDHHTEALECKPGPTHRWHYKYNQQPDDVLFFMQVDSYEKDGVPRRVPHCAFKDPAQKEGTGEPRASIEIRAFVFYNSVEP